MKFFFPDYDPKVIEQKEQSQPACLPLSYVLRFISDATRGNKESQYGGTTGVDIKRKLAIKHHSYSMSSSNRSNTPTGKIVCLSSLLRFWLTTFSRKRNRWRWNACLWVRGQQWLVDYRGV